MKKIKAVIFDLDGVISDTQNLHFEIEVKLFREMGYNVDLEKMKKFSGVAERESYSKILGKEISKNEIEKIVKKKVEILMKSNKIKPIPDVVNLIKRLKKEGFKLGVASSSKRKFVEFVLKKFKIKNLFDAILTQEDVKFTKPNPEIYLKTEKALKVAPQNWLVFEDAPAGILAAKSAKMKCIGITTNFKKEDLKNADEVIFNFGEILSKKDLKKFFEKI